MTSPILSYRGRTITAVDLEAIRALLAAHPEPVSYTHLTLPTTILV